MSLIRKCNGDEESMFFCGRAERDVPLLITGVNGFICSDCAQQAYRIVKDSLPVEHKEKDDLGFDLAELPKPRDIKAYLDQYVIGQDDAKRNLAVAVYNHYKDWHSRHRTMEWKSRNRI